MARGANQERRVILIWNFGQTVCNLNDLQRVTIKGGNLEGFQNTWDMVMLKVPAKHTAPKPQLEILYRKQIRRSYQFAKTFEHYEFEIKF